MKCMKEALCVRCIQWMMSERLYPEHRKERTNKYWILWCTCAGSREFLIWYFLFPIAHCWQLTRCLQDNWGQDGCHQKWRLNGKCPWMAVSHLTNWIASLSKHKFLLLVLIYLKYEKLLNEIIQCCLKCIPRSSIETICKRSCDVWKGLNYAIVLSTGRWIPLGLSLTPIRSFP